MLSGVARNEVDQVVPFHEASNAAPPPEPTAAQKVVDGQLTRSNCASEGTAPASGTWLQVVPSHCSMMGA